VEPADLVDDWPAERVAVIAADNTSGSITEVGDPTEVFHLASITKVITALAVMVAVEEGTVDLERALDADLGAPAGVTVRMLLAHAGGYPFESSLGTLSEPLTRRIYSNSGIEMVGEALATATAMSAVDYITDAVITPLTMTSTTLSGSVAHGATASASDVSRLLAELLEPTLVSRATIDEMTRIQYPDLAGIVPGVGRFDPCPWGLGVEIKGAKSPHWMGRATSARTFGHFGGAGTMAWADPESRRTLVALTDLPFDQWGGTAVRHWATLSDLVSGAQPA